MQFNMNEVQIHKATSDALETLVSFQIQMARETEDMELDFQTVNAGVKHIFDYPEKGYYMLASVHNKIIASLLVLYEWSDWRNGNVAWIHSVYVIPEYRNSGIFKRMYNKLQQTVIEDDSLKGLRLYVEKNNHKARQVYIKLGMSAEHYELYEWMQEL